MLKHDVNGLDESHPAIRCTEGIRCLTLQRILKGLRDYDEVMRGLPDELGQVVRQALEQIGN
jgi:hypothetical protein